MVDNLVARLDFHPLTINLHATAVRENGWDELTLLKVWDELTLPKVWEGGQNSVLKAQYRESLKDVMGRSLRLPTIQKLGTTAREVLEAIATLPCGVEEYRLESAFPGITGVGAAVDALCKFSLLYRQGGFVKMLSLFRFYFLATQHVEPAHSDAANCDATEACTSCLLHIYYTCGVTLFEI